MREIFGNTLAVAGAVAGPMLMVYCSFPRKLRFARRFTVLLTGTFMIGLLVWAYFHRQ